MVTKVRKFDERAEDFRRMAWVGAKVKTAAGSLGVIAQRWANDDGTAAVVDFPDGTSAPVDYVNLYAAPVACVYDSDAARAKLARRKTAPAPMKCGAIYSPEMPTDDESARCPDCGKLEAAIRARQDRKYRREYLATVRKARATMPRLYEELRRIDRTRTVFYLIPHVARSGMSRRIELFYPQKGGGVDVVWPDYEPGEGTTARDLETLRRRINWSTRHRCFVIGGCGMDMVFALVDRLGHVFGFEGWGNKIRRNGLSRAE